MKELISRKELSSPRFRLLVCGRRVLDAVVPGALVLLPSRPDGHPARHVRAANSWGEEAWCT